MEYEKIVSLVEIVEFSEDDEPPSSCESIDYAFAFDCVENINSNIIRTKKNPPFYTKKISPRTDLNILAAWHWLAKNTVSSVSQQKSTLRYPRRIMMLGTARTP